MSQSFYFIFTAVMSTFTAVGMWTHNIIAIWQRQQNIKYQEKMAKEKDD